MKTSLCQLNSYDFTKLSIRWVPSPTDEVIDIENIATGFTYDVWKNSQNELVYMMRFGANFSEETADDQRLGYQVSAEIFAELILSEEVPEDKRGLYIRQNGVSILLGIIRTQIAMNTGSFVGGKFVVPTLMPQDIVSEVEAAKKRARKTTKKVTKKAAKKAARKNAKKKTSPKSK